MKLIIIFGSLAWSWAGPGFESRVESGFESGFESETYGRPDPEHWFSVRKSQNDLVRKSNCTNLQICDLPKLFSDRTLIVYLMYSFCTGSLFFPFFCTFQHLCAISIDFLYRCFKVVFFIAVAQSNETYMWCRARFEPRVYRQQPDALSTDLLRTFISLQKNFFRDSE
jgi:hypothetical protein